MSLEAWITYLAATSILLAIPGPTILLVISYSLVRGRAATIPLIVGVTLGDLTAMTVSFLGLGLLLQTAAVLFQILKWVGAAYLAYLGFRMWREPVEATEEADAQTLRKSGKEMLWRSWITTALNPKGIVFFLAFVPQFLVPDQPFVPQVVELGATFLVLAALNVFAYAVLASRLSGFIRRPQTRVWLNRAGGSLLLGASAATAAS